MATATTQISFTITADTQALADKNRDDAILDYCLAYNLDIYTIDQDNNQVIDPAKAAAAFRSHIRQHVRNVVKAFRPTKAAETARQAETVNTDQILG